MPRKAPKNSRECVVCMSPGHVKQSFNCRTCVELVCAECVGKLAEVCECGCPSARYMCPTCRGETAFIVDHVDDAALLRKLVNKFRSVLSGDGSGAEDSSDSDSDPDFEPGDRRRGRRHR